MVKMTGQADLKVSRSADFQSARDAILPHKWPISRGLARGPPYWATA